MSPGEAILLAAGAIVLGVTFAPFIARGLSHYLTAVVPGWWMGDGKLKVPPAFDRGDAAMKAGEPARALALFREELERAPDDPEVFLRMAGAHRAMGASGQVAACLREAARCAADPHRKGPILLMLAEACGASEARGALDAILGDPALSDYHAAARRRMIPA